MTDKKESQPKFKVGDTLRWDSMDGIKYVKIVKVEYAGKEKGWYYWNDYFNTPSRFTDDYVERGVLRRATKLERALK